jgi:hypothetical protein
MLAFSPAATTAVSADNGAFDARVDGKTSAPEPNRLPPYLALPIIAVMSAGLWVLIWKAGQQVASLLS